MDYTVIIVWIIVVILGLLIYFIPTIVAGSRGSSNTVAVVLINLLLGWSLIGWIVALVMAASSEGRKIREMRNMQMQSMQMQQQMMQQQMMQQQMMNGTNYPPQGMDSQQMTNGTYYPPQQKDIWK